MPKAVSQFRSALNVLSKFKVYAFVALAFIWAGLEYLGQYQTAEPFLRGFNTVMASSFGPDWLHNALTSWWFRLGCLAVGLSILWRIGYLNELALLEASKVSAEQAAVLDLKMQKLASLNASIPKDLVAHFALSADHQRALEWLDGAKMMADKWEQNINAAKATAEIRSDIQPDNISGYGDAFNQQLGGVYVHLKLKPPVLQFRRPVYHKSPTERLPHYRRPHWLFDPDINRPYFEQLEANVADARRAVADTAEPLRAHKLQIDLLAQRIERREQAYYH